MATRRKRRYIDADVEDAIQSEAVETDWTPSQIHARLLQRKDLGDRVPTVRTVQRLVAELRATDTSGPWSVADVEGPEAAAVAESLARVIEHTSGRIRSVTKAEAEWIIRLSHVAPGLAPLERWRVAREYLVRTSRGDSTEALDQLVAFAPWDDDEDGWERYARAVVDGWVRRPSFVLPEVLEITLRGEMARAAIDSAEGRGDPAHKVEPPPEAREDSGAP